MSEISEKFKELRQRREAAFIPYVCGGDPDMKTCAKIIDAVEKHADIMEIGVPFSDPIADGPTIQKAGERALWAGATPRKIIELASIVSKPVVLMTYYNIPFRYGLERFCSDAERFGVSGLICADLPPEEGGALEKACSGHGIDLIFLAAPTSPPERVRLVAGHSRGFVYVVSLKGITGEREALSTQAASVVRAVKKASSTPVAVGFGVSGPEQVRQLVSCGADGVIVGSAIVKRVEENLGKGKKMLEELDSFCSALKAATGQAR
ncbi:MAG: tryptophan synthase subunit alpha [Candidatus Micrarchaeota archaeon]|nr:tryptophan synthase subunit alpha [Candidatus Micrarchaeota archaeon]